MHKASAQQIRYLHGFKYAHRFSYWWLTRNINLNDLTAIEAKRLISKFEDLRDKKTYHHKKKDIVFNQALCVEALEDVIDDLKDRMAQNYFEVEMVIKHLSEMADTLKALEVDVEIWSKVSGLAWDLSQAIADMTEGAQIDEIDELIAENELIAEIDNN